MFTEYLEQHFISSEGSSSEQMKRLKANLLGHCRISIQIARDDVPQLLTAVVNLTFDNPSSQDQLLSADNARAVLATKVADKTIGGEFIWAALARHMGTHHPKSRNDKVSSGPVVANDLSPPPPGLVTSANLKTRKYSGSGNGAYVGHYQLLAFTYEDDRGTLSVIERAADQDEALRAALTVLGLEENQWRAFSESAAEHLTALNPAPLDRQLKQIFVPDPAEGDEGDEKYVVITPLTATAVISAFEQHRTALREQNATLNFHRIRIGGTKPQNAGSLMNELGGNLRQLTMTFPKFTLTQQQQRLWRLQQGRVFLSLRKSEASRFEKWLDRPWTLDYGNRQDHLRQLENRINHWLNPELDEQDFLFAWLASDADDAAEIRLQLKTNLSANWILTLIGASDHPDTAYDVYEARLEAAYSALVQHMKQPLDDTIVELLSKSLEKIFSARYQIKETAA